MAVDVAAASRGFRSVFSLLTPNESSFQTVDEVPKYVQQATPYFVGLMLLELLVGVLRTGGSVVTLSDGVTSISAGMISRLPLLLFRGCELTAYIYVWDHFHLVDLPWDSAWTWWITLLGVDLGYYWVHRCSHEVALLWAAHQVHHSSEYYNLTTALRQSVAQQFSSWIFYLPLALAVPPSVFAVHIQLNLLYQFWIHTELISDLGPLEWIFNTPKHHRVHHGRNIYCLDKNYGGILILWDRLFGTMGLTLLFLNSFFYRVRYYDQGTFAPESDKVIYGLVFPIRTFETLHVQLHYYSHLWKRSRRYRNVSEKILTFINGPSWKPGKRRLGDYEDNPKVTLKEVPHDPSWSLPLHVYVAVHFLLVLRIYHGLFGNQTVLPQGTVVALTAHVLLTLTALGYVIDQRPWAPFLETIRCVALMILLILGHVTPVLPSLAAPTQAFVSLSLIYWLLQGFSQLLKINNKCD